MKQTITPEQNNWKLTKENWEVQSRINKAVVQIFLLMVLWLLILTVVIALK